MTSNVKNIMQQALGDEWHALPKVLQAHYQTQDNIDKGTLSIEYPGWMQLFVNALHLIGALLNRRGHGINTQVVKKMRGEQQYWQRTITFDDGQQVRFNTRWCYAGDNKLIEYVNPVFGLCMSVRVREAKLYYQGEYFVMKLGRLKIPIPEWLLLGHTTIVEQQADDDHFSMDFRLHHPLFGQIYRYAGRFTTVAAT
jgi:hypothetical protein